MSLDLDGDPDCTSSFGELDNDPFIFHTSLPGSVDFDLGDRDLSFTTYSDVVFFFHTFLIRDSSCGPSFSLLSVVTGTFSVDGAASSDAGGTASFSEELLSSSLNRSSYLDTSPG